MVPDIREATNRLLRTPPWRNSAARDTSHAYSPVIRFPFPAHQGRGEFQIVLQSPLVPYSLETRLYRADGVLLDPRPVKSTWNRGYKPVGQIPACFGAQDLVLEFVVDGDTLYRVIPPDSLLLLH